MIGDGQIVGINFIGGLGDAFKNIGVGDPLQFKLRFFFFS